MAVKARAVTVTDSATRLDSTAEEWAGSSLIFYNNGSVTVFLGGSDVTTSNGVPVKAGTWSPALASGKDAVYGIVASGTVEVRILEAGI
jgi:hypothetical protein